MGGHEATENPDMVCPCGGGNPPYGHAGYLAYGPGDGCVDAGAMGGSWGSTAARARRRAYDRGAGRSQQPERIDEYTRLNLP
jgi:hypothetical protein